MSGSQIICLASLFFLFFTFIWWIWKKQKPEIDKHINFINILKKENWFILEQNHKLSQHSSCQADRIRQLHVVLENRLGSLRHLLKLGSIYENKSEIFYKKFREHVCLEAKTKTAFTDLYELTNLYCNGVIEYLKKNYPLLNDEDLRLCCMIALGFSSQEIRLIFSHTNRQYLYETFKTSSKIRIISGNKYGNFYTQYDYKIRFKYIISVILSGCCACYF